MRNNNAMTVLAIIGVVILGWLALNLAGDLIGFVVRVALWVLAGMIAGRVLRGRSYGLLMDALLGLVGGILGSILFGLLGLGGIGNIPLIGSLIVGVVGAVIFVYLVRLVRDRDFAR